MARPKRFRTLAFVPPVVQFVPASEAGLEAASSSLHVEELEAMRLIDLEGLDQAAAAQRMGISRPTVGRILAAARRTVTEALVSGNRLEITGGVYRYEKGGSLTCPHCRHRQPIVGTIRRSVPCRRCWRPIQAYEEEKVMKLENGKIAIASDDGLNVSSHFGRAPFYAVVTLSGGAVAGREQRAKFAPHGDGVHGHGHDAGGQELSHADRHAAMLEPIRDCQVVIAKGMGDGAYVHLTEAGLTVVLTELDTVDEVAEAVTSGALAHQPGRLHRHGA